MISISLATYSIRVREKRGKEYEILGSFGNGHSLASELKAFARHLEKEHANDEIQQSIHRATRIIESKDGVCGLLQSGEYGYAADIVDVATKATTYARQTGEAELIPFFFLCEAPSGKDVGVMMFQRHGTKGIYTAFTKGLRAWFEERHPDLILDIGRLVPKEVMSHLLGGRLYRIEVRTFTPPSDITAKISHLGNFQNVGECVVQYTAEKGSFLSKPGWLRNLLGGKAEIVEIPEQIGRMNERIKITVEYEGSRRKVDFANPESIAPYIDCTGDILMTPDGHPEFDSIRIYSTKLLAQLRKQLGH